MLEVGITVLTLVTSGLFVAWYYQRWSMRKRMPPGPKGYPLLGNALQLNYNHIVRSLTKWKAKFGDIFKINLLGQDVIVVSSRDYIKEVLIGKQDVFAGRPKIQKILPYLKYNEDVIMASLSPTWKTKKKTLLTSLKMYGQELLKLEKVTLECIRKTLQEIEDTKGAPFNPGEKIHLLTGQILAILITGNKLSENQMKNTMAAQTLAEERHFSNTGPGAELNLFPWLRYFGHTVWKEIEENAEILWNIYKDMNEKRKVRQYLLRKLRKKL